MRIQRRRSVGLKGGRMRAGRACNTRPRDAGSESFSPDVFTRRNSNKYSFVERDIRFSTNPAPERLAPKIRSIRHFPLSISRSPMMNAPPRFLVPLPSAPWSCAFLSLLSFCPFFFSFLEPVFLGSRASGVGLSRPLESPPGSHRRVRLKGFRFNMVSWSSGRVYARISSRSG